jgi:hypothetical protein
MHVILVTLVIYVSFVPQINQSCPYGYTPYPNHPKHMDWVVLLNYKMHVLF